MPNHNIGIHLANARARYWDIQALVLPDIGRSMAETRSKRRANKAGRAASGQGKLAFILPSIHQVIPSGL